MPNQPFKSARRPVVYTGSGSAIDNYNSDNPEMGTNWGAFDKNNRQHRQIMSILRQMNWTVTNERWGEVADMSGRFSNWLKSSRSPVQKPLMDMNPSEVSKVIYALEKVELWHFKQSSSH